MNNVMGEIKCLIAEDDDISRMFLEALLREYTANINSVANGEDAVEFCKTNDVHLILMDIKLPVMNGYEATKEIRKFNKNVVIIAQTAYALVGDREKAIEAGCNDYVSKPINPDELKTVLNKYFG